MIVLHILQFTKEKSETVGYYCHRELQNVSQNFFTVKYDWYCKKFKIFALILIFWHQANVEIEEEIMFLELNWCTKKGDFQEHNE